MAGSYEVSDCLLERFQKKKPMPPRTRSPPITAPTAIPAVAPEDNSELDSEFDPELVSSLEAEVVDVDSVAVDSVVVDAASVVDADSGAVTLKRWEHRIGPSSAEFNVNQPMASSLFVVNPAGSYSATQVYRVVVTFSM